MPSGRTRAAPDGKQRGFIVYKLAALWVILILALCACAASAPDRSAQHTADPEHLQDEAEVRAIEDPGKIPSGDTPEAHLGSIAERRGMERILNRWIRERFLIAPSNATLYNAAYSSFLQHKGQFEAEQDEVTGVYSQSFKVQAGFFPVAQASGRIAAIEKERTLGSEHTFVTVELQRLTPDNQGAYFVVARQEVADPSGSELRLIGSGKIYRSLDHTCQAVLLETAQEIMVDDTVYLVQTEVQPMSKQKAELPKATKSEKIPEVVVEPVEEPEEEPLPAEPK